MGSPTKAEKARREAVRFALENPPQTHAPTRPAPRPAMTYAASQPHRCRGGETNPAGGCFACGKGPGVPCAKGKQR